jgi:hypothetical protein
MIHEFRTCTCLPGKLPIVLKRFETATLALFKSMASATGRFSR